MQYEILLWSLMECVMFRDAGAGARTKYKFKRMVKYEKNWKIVYVISQNIIYHKDTIKQTLKT